MKTLINIIWFIFAGVPMAIGYFTAGIIACLLIITIPFGVASFRMGGYVIWPFGRTVIDTPGAGAMTGVANVIWFLIAGWWLVLGHLATALVQFISIIGIPMAIVDIKMIPLAMAPFGKQIVESSSLPYRY